MTNELHFAAGSSFSVALSVLRLTILSCLSLFWASMSLIRCSVISLGASSSVDTPWITIPYFGFRTVRPVYATVQSISRSRWASSCVSHVNRMSLLSPSTCIPRIMGVGASVIAFFIASWHLSVISLCVSLAMVVWVALGAPAVLRVTWYLAFSSRRMVCSCWFFSVFLRFVDLGLWSGLLPLWPLRLGLPLWVPALCAACAYVRGVSLMVCVSSLIPSSTFAMPFSRLDNRFSTSWIASIYSIMSSKSANTAALTRWGAPVVFWVSSLFFARWTISIAVFRNTVIGLFLLLRVFVGDSVWSWVWALEHCAFSVAVLLLLLGFFGAAWVFAFGMTWLVTGVLLSLSGVLNALSLSIISTSSSTCVPHGGLLAAVFLFSWSVAISDLDRFNCSKSLQT